MNEATFMDLLDEYIELKIEGEPTSCEWRSIDENANARLQHRNRLGFLRFEIDAAIARALPQGAPDA